MKLSNILRNMNLGITYDIINDIEFKYLGLSASHIEDDLCIFIDSAKYIDSIRENVRMVITTKDISISINTLEKGLCVVEDPRHLFFEIHNFLSNHVDYKRAQFNTSFGSNCSINPLSSISKNNVEVGNNVVIEEFVVIRENTKINDNTIIRSGSVIGGEGFEFKRTGDVVSSVKHLGGVVIGKNVEIQYNSCVDKAVYPWDNTIIGDYNKIDNLVHIGHAVKTKNNVMIVALSGIGGRTIIKEDSWIGFGAIITNGIEIGKNSRANIGSVVTKSIPNNQSYSGNFAIEHTKFLRHIKKINSEEII